MCEVWLYPSEEQEAMYKKVCGSFLASKRSSEVLEESEVIREACNKSKLGIEVLHNAPAWLYAALGARSSGLLAS